MKTGVFTSNRWKNVSFWCGYQQYLTFPSLLPYLVLRAIWNITIIIHQLKRNVILTLVWWKLILLTENFSLAVCVQEISPYGGQEQCAREEYTCDCLEINGLQSFKVYYNKLTTVLPIVKNNSLYRNQTVFSVHRLRRKLAFPKSILGPSLASRFLGSTTYRANVQIKTPAPCTSYSIHQLWKKNPLKILYITLNHAI